MVQESTMICVDNSEWMRNGDLAPTRLQCQQDAVNLVMQCKLRANPENAVGLLSMAPDVRVLSTMTQEHGRLFAKLHQVEPTGKADFIRGLKVAHLALKHRQNRNHKMRIVLFLGSPLHTADAQELAKLGKKLKKEKVNVDVVCFGGEAAAEDVTGQLNGFIESINGRDGQGSNLLVVGGGTLTEALGSSAICRGEDGAPAGGMGGLGGGAFDMDEDDPDLALALRVSLEEQRQREQQQQPNQQGEGGSSAAAVAPAPQPDDVDLGAMSEQQQFEWALRMSLQDSSSTTGQQAGGEPMDQGPSAAAPIGDDLDELMNDPAQLQAAVNAAINADASDKKKKGEKEAKNKDGDDDDE